MIGLRRPWWHRNGVHLAQCVTVALAALSGCDETPNGIPEVVLANADAIEVTGVREGSACTLGTISAADARQRIADVLVQYRDVHIPGPQGCGRAPPPEQLRALREALVSGAVEGGR